MSYGTKSGPMPYLSMTEEEELYHLLHASKIGYGKTRCDVMFGRDVCEAESTLGGSKIMNGWW